MNDFVGVKLALFFESKLLVFLRDNKPELRFANMWDFPGGGREKNETPFETASREVIEEFGIQLEPSSIRWQTEVAAMHEQGRRAHFMVGDLNSEQIKNISFGQEGQKWTLMTVEEFLSRDDVVPHLKDRLNLYLHKED